MTYAEFLEKRSQLAGGDGFKPVYIPDYLFDFQKALVDWSLTQGRSAIFADCGLGKTPMQLVWADNVVRHTNKPVLILAPLAVSAQTLREAEKFDIDCERSRDGHYTKKIVITNYEKLHLFDWKSFAGVVCDESSILKSFDGSYRQEITDFMRKVPYRLLATATAAPNDYTELGTSSEALGQLGFIDMLNRFFKNDQNNSSTRRLFGEAPKWRFKGHSELPFWRWVTSWARAIRKPSDLGFEDDGFILPDLRESEHLIKSTVPADGLLFDVPAATLPEQRAEKKRTISERCNYAADLIKHSDPAIVWCQLNDEGDTLEEIIPDAVQISGSDRDEKKEESFLSFINGEIRVLITKPKIGAWGLNFQHCNHIVYFPSHSYEQYYQAVRRCWRFGQKRDVTVDIVLTEGEKLIMKNLQRKSDQAARMFDNLVSEMQNTLRIHKRPAFTNKEEVPQWL
ncbi:MAG: helicase [Patescibacteria group bacterium]|nr:helicase [Patescibacteria group bacterium]